MIQIVDIGEKIQVVDNAIVTHQIIKRNVVNITVEATKVIIWAANTSNTQKVELNQASVNFPVSASAQELKDILWGWVFVVDNGNIFDTPILVDKVSDSLTYVGYAPKGTATNLAKWAILKVQKVGTVTSLTWATSYRDMNNVWDDRAILIYS